MNMWKMYSVCCYQVLLVEDFQDILFSILLLLLSSLLLFRWILVLTHGKQLNAWVLPVLLWPHVGDTYLAEPPEHLSRVGSPQGCLVSIIAELKWVALRSGTF